MYTRVRISIRCQVRACYKRRTTESSARFREMDLRLWHRRPNDRRPRGRASGQATHVQILMMVLITERRPSRQDGLRFVDDVDDDAAVSVPEEGCKRGLATCSALGAWCDCDVGSSQRGGLASGQTNEGRALETAIQD